MPPIARAYVKAAFVYFIAAFALGALMAVEGWAPFSRWLRLAGKSQLHLLMVGWITQLAIGVAYWMFPRFRKEQRTEPRGSDRLAWAVLWLLNVGLILRVIAEPPYLMSGQTWAKAVMAVSGVLQAGAALGFGWLIWGRIRSME